MMIREFKYHGKSYMARNLSEILFDKVVAVGAGCDILVPVPMFKKKEKKRGYNQAALLAEFTAKRLGLPYCAAAIERTRNTAPMNRLDARERRRNLENAFKVTEAGCTAVNGRRVMLVDDIYTTGTKMCIRDSHDVVERAAQRRIVKAVILYLVFAREPVVCDPANNE